MKYLLADDHALFRNGVKCLLTEMDPEAQIMEASKSKEAIAIAAKTPDLNLVLLDLCMPDLDGISAMREILSTNPTSLVVILTASERFSDMQLALHTGAVGYIPKNLAPNITMNALQLVLSGGVYMPPTLISDVSHVATARKTRIKLTPMQTEVLKLIIDGQTNKQIATVLNVTESTIKTHTSNILTILNVKNRTQAALIAQKLYLDIDM